MIRTKVALKGFNQMKRTLIGRVLSGGAVMALTMGSFGVSPTLAQEECTCVLPTASGPVGSISTASPDVFVTGATGQLPATAGSPLMSGSVVTTGATAKAGIDLGAGCRFSLAGSMRMQIVPQQGGLCVKVFDDSLPVAAVDNGQIGAAAGLAVGAGLVVSLGMLLSVSK